MDNLAMFLCFGVTLRICTLYRRCLNWIWRANEEPYFISYGTYRSMHMHVHSQLNASIHISHRIYPPPRHSQHRNNGMHLNFGHGHGQEQYQEQQHQEQQHAQMHSLAAHGDDATLDAALDSMLNEEQPTTTATSTLAPQSPSNKRRRIDNDMNDEPNHVNGIMHQRQHFQQQSVGLAPAPLFLQLQPMSTLQMMVGHGPGLPALYDPALVTLQAQQQSQVQGQGQGQGQGQTQQQIQPQPVHINRPLNVNTWSTDHVSEARRRMNTLIQRQQQASEELRAAEESLKQSQTRVEIAKKSIDITAASVHQGTEELTDALLQEPTHWNAMYRKLAEHRGKFGHVDVKRNPTKQGQSLRAECDPDIVKLGSWIGRVRLEARRPAGHVSYDVVFTCI